MDDVQIIILAAGKSKRMKSDEPKALALFKGKPLLRHILETISTLNLTIKPVIVVGYKKELIKEVFGNEHTYIEQALQLGTGHAVKSAEGSVDSKHKIILVISSDQPTISKETIERIISKHVEKKPAVTIATVLVPDFEEWRSGLRDFGRIIRGRDGEVVDIIEFKDATENEKLIKEVNPAVYAFDSDWLWENIDKLKNENAQGEYYLTDLIKLACNQNKKIESVKVANLIEGLQPNTKEELQQLEKFAA
jgi:bifunctional N-acetylglucosamine-1-phosphate-uridyltransferase/glucosamine-1-phosphate-acetyltransferase GlmU-like protein